MDPIDPIDPAFLERSFEKQRLPGTTRVERVHGLRDDQPREEWEQEGARSDRERSDEDEDSVVVELDHTEQPQDLGPRDDTDGPHIDITV